MTQSDAPRLRVAELCAGYGGLYLGLSILLPGAELVWYAENDKYASKVMAEHHPNIPNHGDITQVDWSPVERVDILASGTPCQDISVPGKGAGLEGERSGIVFSFLEAARVMRPNFVLWENVKAAFWRKGEMDSESIVDTVARHLAEMGYQVAAGVFSAAQVGAPHLCERAFLWARLPDAELPRPHPVSAGADITRTLPTPTVVDIGNNKTKAQWEDWLLRMRRKHKNGNGYGRSLSIEARYNLDTYRPALGLWANIVGRPAPAAVDPEGLLSPQFVEWMMGLPEGWVTGVPVLPRTQQLKILGNGVVPQQAASATLQLHTARRKPSWGTRPA